MTFQVATKQDDGRLKYWNAKRVYGPDFKNRVFGLVYQIGMRGGFLEWVDYGVVDYASGLMVGCGDTKAEAIRGARQCVRNLRGSGKWLAIVKPAVQDMNARRKAEKTETERVFELIRKPVVVDRRFDFKRHSVFEKSGGKCHYCSQELTYESLWHVEHVIPKSRGGTNALNNLVASCAPCNMKKANRTAEEFMEGKPIRRNSKYRKVNHDLLNGCHGVVDAD